MANVKEKVKEKSKDNSRPIAVIKSGSRLKNFLKDTQNETKKVTWPDKKSVINSTVLILIIVTIITTFIMCVDLFFTKAVLTLRMINL